MVNKLILVQAPADIQYALHILSGDKESSFKIYAIQVENIYKQLKVVLEDKYPLEFIPYSNRMIGYKSLSIIKKTRQGFHRLWNKYFSTNYKQYTDVYFFSRFEDPFTFFLINRFSKVKGIHIHYWDHYDPIKFNLSFKDLKFCLKRNIIYRFITGASLKITHKVHYPELNINHYSNIERTDVSKAKIKLPTHLYKIRRTPAVLFLLNPRYGGCFYDYDDFMNLVIKLTDSFRERGFIVYVKGHPRMGLPEEIEGHYDERIEDFVISEFIDYTHFSLIIGCESTSIAHAAKCKTDATISMLNMVKRVDDCEYNIYKTHLAKQSDNKLIFARSIDDIQKLCDIN